jgi:hypothetical protein
MAGYKAILPTVVRQYLSPRKASYVIRLSEGVQERKQGTDFFSTMLRTKSSFTSYESADLAE